MTVGKAGLLWSTAHKTQFDILIDAPTIDMKWTKDEIIAEGVLWSR